MQQRSMLPFAARMRSIRKLLGARLKELREAEELRAPQVAAALGVEVSHLYAIERGDNAPSLEVMAALAMLYRIDVADLFTFPATHLRHEVRELVRLTPNAKLAELKAAMVRALAPRRRSPSKSH
jgi:transcriptional regulator with XRE-family HTH domain